MYGVTRLSLVKEFPVSHMLVMWLLSGIYLTVNNIKLKWPIGVVVDRSPDIIRLEGANFVIISPQ